MTLKNYKEELQGRLRGCALRGYVLKKWRSKHVRENFKQNARSIWDKIVRVKISWTRPQTC